MKKDIKQLLREQKLTGDLVGQILIQDMVNSYQQQLPGAKNTEQLLSERDKQQLVAALSTPEEIQVYAQYKQVQRYLLQARLYYMLAWQRAEINYLRVVSTLNQLEGNEDLFGSLRQIPKWSTREAVAEAVREEEHRRAHLMLTSRECLTMMMHIIRQDKQHPLFRAIERVFYNIPGKGEDAARLEKLQRDFPDAYQTLVDQLSVIPGFSAKNLERTISLTAARDAGLDLVTMLHGTPIQQLSPYGFAEMLGGATPPDFNHPEEYSFLSAIESLGTSLYRRFFEFMDAQREIYANRAAMTLLGERIGVSNLEVFLPEQLPEDMAEQMLQAILDIEDWVVTCDQNDPKFREFLGMLEPTILQIGPELPTPEGLAAARAALADLSIVENPVALLGLLMQRAPLRMPQGEGDRP